MNFTPPISFISPPAGVTDNRVVNLPTYLECEAIETRREKAKGYDVCTEVNSVLGLEIHFCHVIISDLTHSE